MLLGHNTFQRGLNDFYRSRGQHVKIEMVAGNSAVENLIQQRDVLFQPDTLADLVKMLLADAGPEFGIVQ